MSLHRRIERTPDGSATAAPRPPRLSLTARLAIGAIVASLLPFVVALAAVSVLPWSTMTRHVRAQQASVERDFAGRTTLQRATLRESIAAVPSKVLAGAVRVGGEAGASRIRSALLDGSSADAVPRAVSVELRPGARRPAATDPPVTVFLQVGTTGVVVSTPLDRAALDRAASDDALQLVVIAVGADGSTHRLGRSPKDAPKIVARPGARPGATPDVRVVGADRGVVRVQALDPNARTLLVTRATGNRLQLLVHDRRSDLGLAFVLLALAGVVGGLASALLVNRGLWGVARAARTIAGGRYDERLPVAGRDAAADVAASLNELAADLDDRIGRLNRTVEQLDRILESIDDGVCLWDAGGELRFHNAAAVRILGGGEADLELEHDLAHVALHAQLRPGRRRAMLPVTGETTGAARGHVAVDLAVVRTRDGGMLQVFHDATRAISLDQARRNFLVTAAHELRTPLTAIVGMVETLCAPELDIAASDRDELLLNVRDQTERLDRVVRAFFENSLLGRDRIEVALGATLLRPVVDEVAEVVPQAQVDPDLLDAGVAVQADRRALVRVLVELVDNAAKYGADGPVSVTSTAVAGSVAIEVVDGGPGVPSGQVEAVFEPFVRLDPEMRTGQGGVGLGLYTARRLVEAMAGTIEIVPRDGELSGRVRVTLPAAPANLTPMPMNANWHRDNPMPRNADERQRAEWHLEHRDACGCRPVPDNILERVAQIEAERDTAPADV